MQMLYSERQLTDTLLERPWWVQIGPRRLALRSPSLGCSLLAFEALQEGGWSLQQTRGLDQAARSLAERAPLAAARFIAYHTTLTQRQAQQTERIERLANELSQSLQSESLAALLLLLLERDPVEKLLQQLGIDQDILARERALELQQDNSWLCFGGRSIYGALIDPIAQRYGWTLEYIIWGISYANLRLLLSDQPTTIYSRADATPDQLMRADDPANLEAIAALMRD